VVNALAVESVQDPVLSGGTLPTGKPMTVYSPYSGAAVGEVTAAGNEDIVAVLDRAQAAVAPMRKLSANERAVLLEKAASLCESRVEELARIVVAEGGKTIGEARAEVGRPEISSVTAPEKRAGSPARCCPSTGAPTGRGASGSHSSSLPGSSLRSHPSTIRCCWSPTK
jgi:hypothetical protein